MAHPSTFGELVVDPADYARIAKFPISSPHHFGGCPPLDLVAHGSNVRHPISSPYHFGEVIGDPNAFDAESRVKFGEVIGDPNAFDAESRMRFGDVTSNANDAFNQADAVGAVLAGGSVDPSANESDGQNLSGSTYVDPNAGDTETVYDASTAAAETAHEEAVAESSGFSIADAWQYVGDAVGAAQKYGPGALNILVKSGLLSADDAAKARAAAGFPPAPVAGGVKVAPKAAVGTGMLVAGGALALAAIYLLTRKQA